MNRRILWPLSLLVLGAACTEVINVPPPGGTPDTGVNTPPPPPDSGIPPPPPGDGGTPPVPPPPPPPIPPPAVYVRGTLDPLYELTPFGEFNRMAHLGVPMEDADFTSNDTVFNELDKLGPDVVPSADRLRAGLIPFRGNPTDVKVLIVNGQTKAFVPLGGDVTAPGDEVTIVVNDQLNTRVRVGSRPQRLALHPAGLVFVCNQYSNFISIIDPTTNRLLEFNNDPVEMPTEYFCADLLFVAQNPQAPDADRQFLYVANRWRRSVLKYDVTLVRDTITQLPSNIESTLVTEITNVGMNPWRLALSDQQNAIFVANNKGGEVSRIELITDTVSKRVAINAASIDIVNIANLLYVPTTMIDRGLLDRSDTHPLQIQSPPISKAGVDGQQHVAHPGSLFDETRSYNFEDVRNGIMQLDFQLNNTGLSQYYTDDNSSEPNFEVQQKVMAGAYPSTVVRNIAGTRIFVAYGGSRIVQELVVNTVQQQFTLTPGRIFNTGLRPYGLFLDEANGRLYVSNWGSETLEVFDLNGNGGAPIVTTNLDYFNPQYPATNVERGELFFYDASWSNTGRKCCASCHVDELSTDGVGYSNGAQAPTVLHQVKTQSNLMTTDAYFWNGSFSNGNYTSVAFKAQTRTNCENIALALIEGPGSNADNRIGDPNNKYTNGRDAECRPQQPIIQGVPANQATIDEVTLEQAQVAADGIAAASLALLGVAFNKDDVARFIDFYSVSQLRLPPNPTRQLLRKGELSAALTQDLADGQQLFMDVGCAACHNPGNTRAPYTDGLNHGAGADWADRFVNRYRVDPRILNSIGQFDQTLIQALRDSTPDSEINIWAEPIDYFIPFCIDGNSCIQFDDPLLFQVNNAEEDRRLQLIIKVNLLDPDRLFVPGAVLGSPITNTPSLRGIWGNANFLRHGMSHSIAEAILPPGHSALPVGGMGWAVNNLGAFDVHGRTKDLTPAQVLKLIRFVESIE